MTTMMMTMLPEDEDSANNVSTVMTMQTMTKAILMEKKHMKKQIKMLVVFIIVTRCACVCVCVCFNSFRHFCNFGNFCNFY